MVVLDGKEESASSPSQPNVVVRLFKRIGEVSGFGLLVLLFLLDWQFKLTMILLSSQRILIFIQLEFVT